MLILRNLQGYLTIYLAHPNCVRLRVLSKPPRRGNPNLVCFAHSEDVFRLWSAFRNRYSVFARRDARVKANQRVPRLVKGGSTFIMSPSRAIEALRRLAPDLQLPPSD